MVPTFPAGSAATPQRGFTYLGLLLAIVLAGTAMAAAGTLWSTESRRSREAELLFVGEQFGHAIAAYRDQAPLGQPHEFPKMMEALLDDKRWPTQRRHLRKVFVDPMTGTREWGVVMAPSGGIAGVYSLSPQAPLKRAAFPGCCEAFAKARTYQDWRFVYGPGAAASSAAGAAATPVIR